MPAAQLIQARRDTVASRSTVRQLLECELADGLEKHEPWLPMGRLLPADEALIGEGGHGVERVQPELTWLSHRVEGIERPATDEDAQARQYVALLRRQQRVAPVDRLAQRLLAGRQVAGATAQER